MNKSDNQWPEGFDELFTPDQAVSNEEGLEIEQLEYTRQELEVIIPLVESIGKVRTEISRHVQVLSSLLKNDKITVDQRMLLQPAFTVVDEVETKKFVLNKQTVPRSKLLLDAMLEELNGTLEIISRIEADNDVHDLTNAKDEESLNGRDKGYLLKLKNTLKEKISNEVYSIFEYRRVLHSALKSAQNMIQELEPKEKATAHRRVTDFYGACERYSVSKPGHSYEEGVRYHAEDLDLLHLLGGNLHSTTSTMGKHLPGDFLSSDDEDFYSIGAALDTSDLTYDTVLSISETLVGDEGRTDSDVPLGPIVAETVTEIADTLADKNEAQLFAESMITHITGYTQDRAMLQEFFASEAFKNLCEKLPEEREEEVDNLHKIKAYVIRDPYQSIYSSHGIIDRVKKWRESGLGPDISLSNKLAFIQSLLMQQGLETLKRKVLNDQQIVAQLFASDQKALHWARRQASSTDLIPLEVKEEVANGSDVASALTQGRMSTRQKILLSLAAAGLAITWAVASYMSNNPGNRVASNKASAKKESDQKAAALPIVKDITEPASEEEKLTALLKTELISRGLEGVKTDEPKDNPNVVNEVTLIFKDGTTRVEKVLFNRVQSASTQNENTIQTMLLALQEVDKVVAVRAETARAAGELAKAEAARVAQVKADEAEAARVAQMEEERVEAERVAQMEEERLAQLEAERVALAQAEEEKKAEAASVAQMEADSRILPEDYSVNPFIPTETMEQRFVREKAEFIAELEKDSVKNKNALRVLKATPEEVAAASKEPELTPQTFNLERVEPPSTIVEPSIVTAPSGTEPRMTFSMPERAPYRETHPILVQESKIGAERNRTTSPYEPSVNLIAEIPPMPAKPGIVQEIQPADTAMIARAPNETETIRPSLSNNLPRLPIANDFSTPRRMPDERLIPSVLEAPVLAESARRETQFVPNVPSAVAAVLPTEVTQKTSIKKEAAAVSARVTELLKALNKK